MSPKLGFFSISSSVSCFYFFNIHTIYTAGLSVSDSGSHFKALRSTLAGYSVRNAFQSAVRYALNSVPSAQWFNIQPLSLYLKMFSIVGALKH